MNRKCSHFENKELFFEKILRSLRFRKVIRHIPQNSKILDIGCGYNGKLLHKLKDRISSGFGIDISVSQESPIQNITLKKHNLVFPLPFENGSFDVATSLANLEHLDNPTYALREIYRVLKPGGWLILTVPTIFSKPILEFLSYKLKIISEQEIRDHKHYADKKILTAYCEKIGFSSFKHIYFQFWMNNLLIAKK